MPFFHLTIFFALGAQHDTQGLIMVLFFLMIKAKKKGFFTHITCRVLGLWEAVGGESLPLDIGAA